MGQPSTVTAYVGDSLRLEATIDRSTTPASQYQWFKYVDGVHDIPLTQPSASRNISIPMEISRLLMPDSIIIKR